MVIKIEDLKMVDLAEPQRKAHLQATLPLCPGCGHIADSVSGLGGWRFYCDGCAWGWGHPQLLSYQDAVELRAKAREQESK